VAVLILFEFSLVPPVDYLLVKRQTNDIQMYQWLSNQEKDNISLHLPMGVEWETRINYDILHLFNSRHGFPKIVNGYSGYYPPGYLRLAQALMVDFEPQEDLAELKKFKVDYLIFHFNKFDQWQDYKKETLEKLDNSDNFVLINNFGENYIYQVNYD